MSIDAEMSPAQLLDTANGLLVTVTPAARSLWPRTVAFLVRMALEETLGQYWSRVKPGIAECSMRAQLLCLREYAGQSLAGRAAATWGALSSACHYHHYDLAPTAAELRSWHTEVNDIRSELLVGALTLEARTS